MKAVENLMVLFNSYYRMKHREPLAFVPRLMHGNSARVGSPFTTFMCAKFIELKTCHYSLHRFSLTFLIESPYEICLRLTVKTSLWILQLEKERRFVHNLHGLSQRQPTRRRHCLDEIHRRKLDHLLLDIRHVGPP